MEGRKQLSCFGYHLLILFFEMGSYWTRTHQAGAGWPVSPKGLPVLAPQCHVYKCITSHLAF